MANEIQYTEKGTLHIVPSHPKYDSWMKKTFDLDYKPEIKGKSVMIKGRMFKGAKFFPISCVEVIGFEITIPVWLLKKNDLNYLT